jgi:hypothetical protein
MSKLVSINFADRAKRAHRASREKNPSLPALIAGAAEIAVVGAETRVTLPTIDGGSVGYAFTHVDGWRCRRMTSAEFKNRIGNAAAIPAPALESEIKQAIEAVLTKLAALEKLVHAANGAAHPLGAE